MPSLTNMVNLNKDIVLNDVEFLQAELDNGISLENAAFRNLADATADQMLPFGYTVLDYGAGVGAYTNSFINKGFKVYSYEIFKAHREYMLERIKELNLVNDPVTTDIMLFIEVAEHMTDAEIDKVFKSIKPNYILFSSTSEHTEYDDAWGHINIKSAEDWSDLFLKYNYILYKYVPYPTEYSKIYKLISK